MRYTFGNTITASQRLERIADFFNPLAKEFLQAHFQEPVQSVADLGCGPGFTTYMLQEALQAKSIIGYDQSDYFIEEARERFPTLHFQVADVTAWEPSQKFDLVYCRFLLSHLNNLEELITSWLNYLNPNGKIVLDELEDVITDVPLFRNYLQISSALVKSQGAELYIGKQLSDVMRKFSAIIDSTQIIPVPDRFAAGWFYGNTIGPWKTEPYILKHIPEHKASELSDALYRVYNKESSASNITWKMKRIILTH